MHVYSVCDFTSVDAKRLTFARELLDAVETSASSMVPRRDALCAVARRVAGRQVGQPAHIAVCLAGLALCAALRRVENVVNTHLVWDSNKNDFDKIILLELLLH